MRGRSTKQPKYSFWLLSLAILIALSGRDTLGLGVEPPSRMLKISSGTTVYDFIAHAPEAQWSSGAGALPFPGDPSDSRGFARYVINALLEDGSTWSKVLETHPQWVAGGWIMGVYPQQTVPPNSQLTVRIGFLSGATGTDGAEFDVYFDEYRGMNVAPLRHTILSKVATLDGKLDLITEDLSFIAGKKGNFVLRVYAGKTSNRDWAVWAEAKIETKPLPDLVITDVWESGGLVHYKVKNVGDAPTTPTGMPAKSFCNCLSIDGEQVVKHCITQVLQPGQEVEGVFDYAWKPTPGEHVVKVCADCEQNIEESNEGNNCLEEKWLKENLPDLVIDEIICDRNNSLIGYVLKNVGGEVAKGNHSTTLYVDGKEVAHDPVGVDLKPGDVFKSWFRNYEWPECRNITVKVCADNFNQVKESDEGNNCLEKTCISYPVPIIIVSGPRVVNVTQDSVTVIWITNKNSDSTVVYSDRSTGEEKTFYDSSLVKNHTVRIAGLKPRTTYRFYVGSKDRCGNAVISKTMVFETTSPPDTEKPSVTLFLPERLVGVVNILANASDNVGIGGVMFSIDGVVKFIDFSPPYVWVFNTTLFRNGVHNFSAAAFDAAGNEAIDTKEGAIDNPIPDTNPPLIRIIKPNKEWVHDLVEIEAWIEDKESHKIPAGYIQAVELYIDGVLMSKSIYPAFSINPLTREIIVEPARSNLTFTYLWNATGLEPNSEHTIEVKAWDNSGNYGYDSIRVKIFSMMPIGEYLDKIRTGVIKIINIEVTREVVRHDVYQTAYFVTLRIRNTGTETLYNITLRDDVCGFQVIPHTAFMSVDFAPSFWTSTVVFKPPGEAALSPGSVATIQYLAVPILFAPTIPDECYIFGWLDTYVSFSCDGISYGRSFSLRHHPDDFSSVLGSADYIIITNPSRLFSNNAGDEEGVNALLIKMAELAMLKRGVLGYLREDYRADEANEIKAFISPSGAWSSRLPNFAYLLIVGEENIVPSYTISAPNIFTCDPHDQIQIKLSDQPYANVWGDERPDIILGRIIGINPEHLIKPIEASMCVLLGLEDYDGSDALLVSGPEGTWEHTVKSVELGRSVLIRKGVYVKTVHTEYYTTEHDMLSEALRIRGAENGGARFDANLDSYDVEQLAIWLLDSVGEYWAKWAVEYDHFTDTEGRQHMWAPAYTGDPEIQLALRIAEVIQVSRTFECGWDTERVKEYARSETYKGTYAYFRTADEIGHARADSVKANASDKDVILFLGHGNTGSWGCVLDAWIPATVCDIGGIDFGRSRPVVLAFSCSTGDYSGGLQSIAEAFLRNGAAAYIGSTEVSAADLNEQMTAEIFWNYWSRGSRIGAIFYSFKRDKILEGDCWRLTCYEYNLYGDPKFGG